MKTIYYIFRLCFFSLLIPAIGCTEHDPFKMAGEGAYKSTIMLGVEQSLTRVDTAPEDEVKRVDVMLFREGVLEKVMKNITSFENTDGHSSITVSFETEGVRKAYIVANNDDELWMGKLDVGKTTVEEALSFRTASLEEMANPPLVMYGISENITFSTSQSSVLCNLYRVVAKVDVANKAAHFKLVSARLLRSKVSANIFPGGPIVETAMKDFSAEAVAEGHVLLYTYETTAENIENTTAIEIAGEVNGAQLTDTIHFVSEGKLLDIERNYCYTININDVRKNSLVALIDVKPWKMGDDIDEVVLGNKPLVDIIVSSAVGTYSKSDSTLTLISAGGAITIDVKSNADCELELPGNWIGESPQTRAESFISNRFSLVVEANIGEEERVGEIKVINKISNFSQTVIIRQAPGKVVADKYMILVVAGQSNAVGYDESPLDAEDLIVPERALQLSYRNGPSSKKNLSVIPLTWCADDVDAHKRNSPNNSGQYGLKGIHLPLAKELLKYIPADYNIVVVPVAYASSRFASLSGTSFGTYNSALKRPNEINTFLQWGEASAYRNTIVDRVKHLLDIDNRNKFLGVVWCQGENDCNNADHHYTEFTKMSEGILRDLNNMGYGGRSNYGTIDKRSWYTHSSCSSWVDWYSEEDASAVFGGYKAWNPDTYIHAPSDLPSNPGGGPGMGKHHFGKNAYREIAGMVATRMNQNGLLFNNAPKVSEHFADKTTPAQAVAQGGSMNDSDVSTSLIMMAPFDQSVTEKIGNPSISPTNMSLIATEGLKDINGNSRSRSALSLSDQSGYLRIRGVPTVTDWSMSFMFRRTGNLSSNIQSIIAPQGTNAPFIGFRKYSSVMGVAKAAEFVVEPIFSGTKKKAVPGQFMAASKVRALDEWVHYIITYSNATKETCIYMNGDLVQKAFISNTSAVALGTVYIGNISPTTPGATGQLMDFGLWGKVLTPPVMRKIFLMSYYGYTK